MSKNLTIVGSGVVGTATGKAFSANGVHVTFVDVNPSRIKQLRSEGFRAFTPDQLDLTGTDAVFISVPTPSGPGGQITTYLEAATESIGYALRYIGDADYPVVVFRCTQLPGMTAKLTGVLEDISGKKAGVHFGVVYNPEYLRAENPTADKNPLADSLKPLVVTIGHDPEDELSVVAMQELYEPFGAPMEFMSIPAAEFQKYVHNVFNAVKISAMNEFRMLGASLGITDKEVDHAFAVSTVSAEGLRNPAYGTRNMGPYNGACLPKEVLATLALADQLGLQMPVVAATHEINERMKSGMFSSS